LSAEESEALVIYPGAPERDRVLIVGHRGAEAVAPENTWPALEAGYRAGADLLELDVQLTRDGQAVLFHDFTLMPKLGDPRWLRELAWDEVRGLDVGRWFDPAFAGQRMPRLEEALTWARERVALWLDLKHGFVEDGDDRLEMAVLDLVEAHEMGSQVLISSWDQVALARIRARCPQIVLGVNLRERVPDPAGQVLASGARWVTVWWPQADVQSVAQLRRAGLCVNLTNLFTSDFDQARHLGVDAVTAPNPATARAALGLPGGQLQG
jgi:glycerophosphoryl diester phosphodiesterase